MADRAGQQLGNYRLTRLLGKGGFAEVYLGEHVYLKTPVAVKVLHTQVVSDNMAGFLNEAQTIARLIHPHIVRVTDFGLDGETPFLVMDYAPNGTLRQRHPHGSRLDPPTIVPYVKQIAEALQYAHDEKFIHRDIKPENMLLGRRNEVLLSDFGIALVAQSSRYQSTQDVIGTVAYMSPEQIQGKPRQASDQYSLAIVVYEWLSGNRPFHGSFTELCAQHMFAPPPPLREKNPSISPAIDQIVQTALAKEPKQRFMNIQAFANAFEQACQSNQPTFVKPRPASQPPSYSYPQQPRSVASSLPPTQFAGSSSPMGMISPSSYPVPQGQNIPASTPAPAKNTTSRPKSSSTGKTTLWFVLLLLFSIFVFFVFFGEFHYSLFTSLVVLSIGLITGFLASLLMRGGGYGLVGDIVVGMIGAMIGGFGAALFGLYSLILVIIVAFIGACILIAILRAISRGPRRRL